MINTGVFAYAAAAIAFTLLTALLLRTRRQYRVGMLFIVAAASSSLWAAAHAYNVSTLGTVPLFGLEALELMRAASWFMFLFGLLGQSAVDKGDGFRVLGMLKWIGVSLVLILLASLMVLFSGLGIGESRYVPEILRIGHLLLAVYGLVLIEQLFRNSKGEQRWAVKFVCLGIGVLFAFDFYIYAEALLLKHIDINLWSARGVVNVLVAPLVVIAARREPLWTGRLAVSRHIVFHGVALLSAGIYLLLMAAVGYYVRAYGGQWGALLQLVFFFGALTVLTILAVSGQMRARLKVFVAKHFFASKYDYRGEWLRFVDVLSRQDEQEDVRLRILQGIAEITESTSGILWTKSVDGAHFAPVAAWNMTLPVETKESANASLPCFLGQRQWVVDLKEQTASPGLYENLSLPSWMSELPKPRLVVPLVYHDDVNAFVVLGEPRADRDFDWEDHDLLKTVGRQAASYLKLIETSEALFEARQFEAFNRLSAFVVHDLKNLAAQLSLVVSNAKKHMHNPEFVTDTVHTVENSVAKMNRMLAQLRKKPSLGMSAHVCELTKILEDVVTERSSNRPIPHLNILTRGVATIVDPDRLAAVIGHIIQNAQEATPDDGKVEVRLDADDAWVTIDIEDSGCGMDEQFVRSRLFRPFDTTKGNAGMGVGAYETREFVHANGGAVDVWSQPGQGTTIRLKLPRHRAVSEENSSAQLGAAQ